MENKDGIRDQRLGLLVGVESSLNSTQEGGVLSENMMGVEFASSELLG